MQRLNYLTMLTAVRDCVRTDGFRVGIFTRTQADRMRVFSDMMESMDEEEREAKLRAVKSTTNTFVEFKNGSCIKVLGASENARGHAFHKVLYEDGIGDGVLDCVIRYTEKLRF